MMLWIGAGALNAQDCMCEQAFRSVRAYFEENHPGYNAMDAQARMRVDTSADSLAVVVSRHQPQAECILYLQHYVRLLRDNHSYIEIMPPAQKEQPRPGPGLRS